MSPKSPQRFKKYHKNVIFFVIWRKKIIKLCNRMLIFYNFALRDYIIKH